MKAEIFDLHAEIETSHWWFTARRRIVTSVVCEVVPPSRESLIVDIGCGTGADIAALAAEYSCLGTDPYAPAIEHARRRFPHVRFHRAASIEDIRDAVEPARLFMLMDVLEHVPDDFQLLSSVLSVARPGAYVLLTVPADPALWSEHDIAYGHYRRYDRARLEAVWAGLPVEPVLVSYFNARLWPAIRVVRAVSRLRGEAHGNAGTDLRIPPRPLNALLRSVFGGEAARLLRLIRRPGGRAYPAGVSLIALLHRKPGVLHVRNRPEHVQPDLHAPPALKVPA